MGDDVDILVAAGKALYGERWRSSIARDLATTDRSIRNWMSRVHPMPVHARTKLEALLVERAQLIRIVLETIRA
ncbi:hypothetical protein [Sphingomonas sp. PvP056]|uniref:hypothetical protein n=1 Tax=Sphingomonas sp. PvP056 TaxID=3156392 RepID=UPI003399EFBD